MHSAADDNLIRRSCFDAHLSFSNPDFRLSLKNRLSCLAYGGTVLLPISGLDLGSSEGGFMIRWLFKAASVLTIVQLSTALPAMAAGPVKSLDPEPPFVICESQRYALCAQADCFVYNGVAYCR